MIQEIQEKVLPDFKNQYSKAKRYTVLIFDSGIGGLSVYDKIRQILPELHYIYVFDNIAFPYGNKNETFIFHRVMKIISSLQKKYALALAVIACNTASVISLSRLRKKFTFPVIGVVPNIKTASSLTKNGSIGLLATHNTIHHAYTHNLIKRFANGYQVITLSSAKLVEMAEAKLHGEPIKTELVRLVLNPWLCMEKLPSVIVLGCTHFSLLEKEISNVLPKKINLIDSSSAIARQALWLLADTLNNKQSTTENIAYCMFLTQKTEKLLPTLYSYGFKKLKTLLL